MRILGLSKQIVTFYLQNSFLGVLRHELAAALLAFTGTTAQ